MYIHGFWEECYQIEKKFLSLERKGKTGIEDMIKRDFGLIWNDLIFFFHGECVKHCLYSQN